MDIFHPLPIALALLAAASSTVFSAETFHLARPGRPTATVVLDGRDLRLIDGERTHRFTYQTLRVAGGRYDVFESVRLGRWIALPQVRRGDVLWGRPLGGRVDWISSGYTLGPALGPPAPLLPAPGVGPVVGPVYGEGVVAADVVAEPIRKVKIRIANTHTEPLQVFLVHRPQGHEVTSLADYRRWTARNEVARDQTNELRGAWTIPPGEAVEALCELPRRRWVEETVVLRDLFRAPHLLRNTWETAPLERQYKLAVFELPIASTYYDSTSGQRRLVSQDRRAKSLGVLHFLLGDDVRDGYTIDAYGAAASQGNPGAVSSALINELHGPNPLRRRGPVRLNP